MFPDVISLTADPCGCCWARLGDSPSLVLRNHNLYYILIVPQGWRHWFVRTDIFYRAAGPLLSVQWTPQRKCFLLDAAQTREGCRAFPLVQQQRRSLLSSQHTHTRMHARTHLHTCTHTYTLTHAVSLSAAGECPVRRSRVMAQYAPQAYGLSDEQEYLQAYEDVLEKYKGRIIAYRTRVRLRNDEDIDWLPLDSSINVRLTSLYLLSSSHWLGSVSLSLQWKSGNISRMTSLLGWIWVAKTKALLWNLVIVKLEDYFTCSVLVSSVGSGWFVLSLLSYWKV